MRALKKIFSLFQDKREFLDPNAFGSEIAFKTSWEPLAGGGTNFCTHRAKKNTSLMGDAFIFKTTIEAYFFAIIFVVLGVTFTLVGAADGFSDMSGIMGLAFLSLAAGINGACARKSRHLTGIQGS